MSHSKTKRLYFFDNLRAFIILLMVVFHIAMGYTTWDLKWWYVNDTEHSAFFDLFVFSTDVYIMPVMFLIAGYFAPMVLQRKGQAAFWRGKLLRIALPWVLGVIFCAPIIAYAAFLTRPIAAPPYLEFWTTGFFGPFYQQAQYWFLGMLFGFFAVFSLAARLFPRILEKAPVKKAPSPLFLLAFFAFTAMTFFVGDLYYWCDTWMPGLKGIFFLQPVRLGIHISYFCLGIYAWKYAWFSRGGWQPRLVPWCSAAVVSMAVFLIYRVMFTLMPEPPVLFRAGHAFTHSLLVLTAVFALLAIFQRFIDSDAWLWRRLSANSYTIYFIHFFIIIPIGALLQQHTLPIALKYLLASSLSLVLCFLAAEYLIQPLLSLVLHRKKARRLNQLSENHH